MVSFRRVTLFQIFVTQFQIWSPELSCFGKMLLCFKERSWISPPLSEIRWVSRRVSAKGVRVACWLINILSYFLLASLHFFHRWRFWISSVSILVGSLFFNVSYLLPSTGFHCARQQYRQIPVIRARVVSCCPGGGVDRVLCNFLPSGVFCVLYRCLLCPVQVSLVWLCWSFVVASFSTMEHGTIR